MRMHPRALALAVASALACAPGQPARYCDETSDCQPYHVCDAFTRTCRMATGHRGDGAAAWGEFLCFEGNDPADFGYFVVALDREVVRALGVEVSGEGTPLMSGRCRTVELEGVRLFNYPSWTPLGGGPTYTMNLIIAPGALRPGGRQVDGPQPYPLFSIQIGAEMKRGMPRGVAEIQEYDESHQPPFVRGEFVARGEMP